MPPEPSNGYGAWHDFQRHQKEMVDEVNNDLKEHDLRLRAMEKDFAVHVAVEKEKARTQGAVFGSIWGAALSLIMSLVFWLLTRRP